MGAVFDMAENRDIYVAHQNCFTVPVKHPSRIMEEHVISYVLEGEWVLYIGKELVHAKKDNVFVMPARLAHIGVELCPENTKTMFVHFARKDADFYGDSPAGSTHGKQISINSLIDAQNKPRIKEVFLKTINEKRKGNDIKASVYLDLLLCELSDSSYGVAADYSVARRAGQLIQERLYGQLSNKEIAQSLNVSLRTLEGNFRQYYHTSVRQYIIMQRISSAKFILEYSPERKIVEIARELGFYDEYHFSRQFKRVTGYSPTEYREIIKEKYFLNAT